jgi:hypothetical protein
MTPISNAQEPPRSVFADDGPVTHPEPVTAPRPEPEPETDDRPAVAWPRFTLPELADQEALAYHAWRNPAGDLFARTMEELAQKIRFTGASTPADYWDRIEVMDAAVRQQWEQVGFDEGFRAGRASVVGLNWNPTE